MKKIKKGRGRYLIKTGIKDMCLIVMNQINICFLNIIILFFLIYIHFYILCYILFFYNDSIMVISCVHPTPLLIFFNN